MRFAAAVRADGSLLIYAEEAWKKALIKRKGQRVELELRDEAAIRSHRANAYWWAVCVPFVQECWQRETGDVLPLPKEAVHDALVTAFGGGVVMTPLGKARRNSTAAMTVVEFSTLIDAVREYALQKYGSVIPTPEEWGE